MIRDKLDKLRQPKSPIEKLPAGVSRGVIWVKPELVAQVSFSTWTADNLVRQAAFKGLREDKPAQSVQRESPEIDAKQASHQSHSKTRPSRHAAKAAAERDGLRTLLQILRQVFRKASVKILFLGLNRDGYAYLRSKGLGPVTIIRMLKQALRRLVNLIRLVVDQADHGTPDRVQRNIG